MAVTFGQGQRNLTGTDATLGQIISSSRRVRDVSNEISLLDVGNNALLTLLRKLRKGGATDPKVEWFEDAFPTQWVTIAAGDTSVVDTTLTVSTADSYLLRAGDVLLVADTQELLYVKSMSTTTVTVIRGVGGSTAADIESGDVAFIVGNAQTVGETARTSLTTQVDPKYNYTQIMKESWEIDNTANATRLFGGNERKRLNKKHGEIHTKDHERALWWGGRDKFYTAAALKVTYMMGGVDYFLSGTDSEVYNDASEYTEDEFDADLRTAFRYGMGTKFMFCSPLALSVISSWGRDKLRAVPRDKTWGINITRYISPHGELNLINNKLFGDFTGTELSATSSGSIGNWATASVILDLNQLEYRALRDTRLEMNIQENDRDATEDQYLTESTLVLRLPDHHMQIFGWALS